MVPSYRLGLLAAIAIAHVWSWSGSVVVAQDPTEMETPAASEATEETDEEKKQRVTTERFLQLLKRSPRLGTSLDRVYGYHVGKGTLDEFSDSIRSEAETNEDGKLWMIHGMVELQRGRDVEAGDSFRKAQELLPEEPLASYYLGKSLVLVGDVEGAAAAMRAAIERGPARPDMLAIFQDLGRILQRTGQSDEALEVWKEVEAMFPGDSQVREEIARILAEEGALEAAIERYDALAKSEKDRFRSVEVAIRSAQLKAELGRTEDALSEFEALLSKVNPDSWLHRDIRRRIEEVFWSRGDADGLVTYYTKWVEQHPDDVDAMMRTARYLAIQRRLPEAEDWFHKAIDKAPTSADIRMALVEALVTEGQSGKAATEMEQLIKVAPGNPDYLVRWGELVFNDLDRSEADREAEAVKIWKSLLKDRGDDPVTVARVADLLRNATASDEAIELYRRAIELAPAQPQYREYLGEYLHQLGRKDDAVEVWQQLAMDDRKSRDNLVRLSEVYSTFGYPDRALETMAQACGMNPTFGHRARYAELLREAQRYDDSLAQLDLAEPLAEDPELRELLVAERIKNYQESDTLATRIEAAEAAVVGDQSKDPKAWRMLALLREADRKFQAACEAADQATKLAPGDPVAWEIAAVLQERSGRFGDAIQSYRKLAGLDRRYLSNYLQQIASLELRVGNTDEAKKACEQLVASAPNSTEHYRFFADICFQIGEEEQAFAILRRGIRANPTDQDSLLHLAQVLGEAFQTDEAIELYWRAFDQATELDGRTAAIAQLAELYLRINRFDALLDRLDSIAREQNSPREGTLWVAAAHQAAGDLGMARQLLEQLARQSSRDTKLFEQLVGLARAEYDFEMAAEYQKRLVAISPTPEAEFQLANILLELGEIEQSEAIWMKLAQRKGSPTSLNDTIGNLIQREEFDTAAALVERSLADKPDDWESLGWAMIVYSRQKEQAKAQLIADRVLKMNVEPGEPTEKSRQALERQASRANRNRDGGFRQHLGRPSRMLEIASQVKQSLTLSGNDPYMGQPSQSFTPSCFADVCAIAYGVPMASDSKDFSHADFVEEQVSSALQSKSSDALWKAVYYLVWQTPMVRYGQVQDEQFDKCIAALVEQQDPAAAGVKLQYFMNQRQRSVTPTGGEQKPLDEEELAQLKEWVDIASGDLTAANYYELLVAAEFVRAGQSDVADEMIDRFVESSANSGNSGQALLQVVAILTNERYNADLSDRSIEKAISIFKKSLEETRATTSSGGYSSVYASLMKRLVEEDHLDTALSAIDAVLEWQAKETAGLRPSQRNQIATAAGPLTFGQSVNGRYVQTVIEFPPPSGCFSSETIYCLHGTYEACKDNPDLLKQFRGQLAAWAAKDSDDPYLRLARQLAKASVANWAGDMATMKQSLAAAAELQLDLQFIDLARARMLYQAGDISQALEVVESLRATNQSTLVDRELTILQLVVELGDLDRARASAQRLFALRLPSETEFKLADLMYQLGMQELGDRMMSRIRRRSGNQQSTLSQLMNRYASNGKDKEAAEVARQIVRRTEPRVSRNYVTAESQQHDQALSVLARTDELTPLIEQYEKLVERSPKSSKLVNKLASFYEAAGRRQDAQSLRLKAVESVPDDPRNLLAAGMQLAGMRQYEKASEKFAAAIIKQPELLNNDYYEMRQSFQESKSWGKLIDAMIDEGLSKFTRSYRMSEIVSELAQANDNETINKLLRAALVQMSLPELSQMLYSVGDSRFEVEDDVAQLLAEKLISDNASFENFGSSTYVYSRSSNGNTRGFIDGVAAIVTKNAQLKGQVADAMQKRLAKNKNELFPRVLLARIFMEDGKFEEVKQLLKPLVEKGAKDSNDGEAIFSLASHLVHRAKQPSLACDLLESVDDSLYSQEGSDFTFTAQGLQAYAYQQADRKADARRMLVDYMSTVKVDEEQNRYNPGYGESRYIRSNAEVAKRLLDMGYPAEAYIAYRNAYGDETMLQRASRWGGNSEYEKNQLDQKIREKTNAQAVIQIIESVLPSGKLADAEQSDSGSAVAAEFLTSGEVVRDSMIDVRVTMPLEQFALKLGEEKAIKDAIAKWLKDAKLEQRSGEMPLRSLVTWLLVSDAIDDQEQTEKAAMAVLDWVAANEPPSSAESTEGQTAKDDSTQSPQDESLPTVEDATNPIEEELLLGIAADRLPEAADADLSVKLLQRARDAAAAGEQDDLVRALDCRIAKAVAQQDPDRARKALMSALDELLPSDKEVPN